MKFFKPRFYLLVAIVAMLIVSSILFAGLRGNSTHQTNKQKIVSMYSSNVPLTFREYKEGAGSATAIGTNTTSGTLYHEDASYLKTDVFYPNGRYGAVQFKFVGDTIAALIEIKAACTGTSGALSISEDKYTTVAYITNAAAAVTTQDSVNDKTSAVSRTLYVKPCLFDLGGANAFYIKLSHGKWRKTSITVTGDLSLPYYY